MSTKNAEVESPPQRQSARTQRERSSASSEAMLRSAIQLMARKGSRASLLDVGRESGFSHGLALSRFGSKAGLIESVIRATQRGFMDMVDDRSQGKGPLARVIAILDLMFDTALNPPEGTRCFYALMGEAIGSESEFREHFVEADRRFRTFVEIAVREAIECGELISDIEPAATSALLVGIVRGATAQILLEPEAFDVEIARAEVRRMVGALTPAAAA